MPYLPRPIPGSVLHNDGAVAAAVEALLLNLYDYVNDATRPATYAPMLASCLLA